MPQSDPPSMQPGDRLFRLLVDAVEEYAIFLLDPDGRVASWNAGAARIKGYLAPEILGRHFSVFFTSEDQASGKPGRELQDAALDGSAQDEGWRVRKDGSLFWASVVVTALRGQDGALVGFAKMTRDMTDRRRAEQVRNDLEVTRRAVQIRDEFLSIASHELRTPVTSLLLIAQGIRRWAERSAGALPPAQERQMLDIERQCRRLTTLVDNLLEVTILTSGGLGLRLERTDLGDMVRALARRLGPHAARRGVALQVEGDTRADGEWDAGRIEEAVSALVDNAIKYGQRRPVTIRVSADAEWARVTVEDQGIGIRPDDQERIFERFERAAPSTQFSGFGVGLWAARQIAAAHGGDITVRSAPGQGARFELRLPRKPAHGSRHLTEAGHPLQ